MNIERSFFKRNISRALIIAGLLFAVVTFVPNAFLRQSSRHFKVFSLGLRLKVANLYALSHL
jgi:hypothetical protein